MAAILKGFKMYYVLRETGISIAKFNSIDKAISCAMAYNRMNGHNYLVEKRETVWSTENYNNRRMHQTMLNEFHKIM